VSRKKKGGLHTQDIVFLKKKLANVEGGREEKEKGGRRKRAPAQKEVDPW